MNDIWGTFGVEEKTPVLKGRSKMNDEDKTKEHLLEELNSLRETREFLQNILESSSSISIVSTDLCKNVLYWNRGAEDIFGYRAEEIVGRQKIDILYPEDTRRIVGEIRSLVFRDGKGTHCEVEELTKDGRRVWINLTLTPRFAEDGRIMGILGIGQDITERRRAEEELRRSHDDLERQVTERTADLISLNKQLERVNKDLELAYVQMRDRKDRLGTEQYREEMGFLIDREGRILGVTERAKEDTGRSRTELLGSTIMDLMDEDSGRELRSAMRQAWTGMSCWIPVRIMRESAERRAFETKLACIDLEREKEFLVLMRASEREEDEEVETLVRECVRVDGLG